MKILVSFIVFVMCLTFLVGMIVADNRASYRYENTIHSNWTLADRASTIQQKSDYMDKFVAAIERANITGYNAVIYPTPENAAATNIEALKSLQQRLHEIKGMKPTSFEYQTAIQQITQQEQGEATGMLNNIYGAWLLNCGYWYLWGWITGLINATLIIVGLIAGIVFGITSGLFEAIQQW